MASNEQINLPDNFAQAIQNNPEVQQRRQQSMPAVQRAAEKYNIPAGLLDMSIMQESKYDAGASGDNGQSTGLAQIQDATAKDYGISPECLNDPNCSIDAMAKIYSGIRDQIGEDNFNDWGRARVAYQSGPGAIGNRDSWGPIAEDNYKAGQKYQALNDAGYQQAQRPQQNDESTEAVAQAMGLEGILGSGRAAPQPVGRSTRSTAQTQQRQDQGYSSAQGGNVGTQQVESLGSTALPEINDGRRFQAQPYQDFYANTFGKPGQRQS